MLTLIAMIDQASREKAKQKEFLQNWKVITPRLIETFNADDDISAIGRMGDQIVWSAGSTIKTKDPKTNKTKVLYTHTEPGKTTNLTEYNSETCINLYDGISNGQQLSTGAYFLSKEGKLGIFFKNFRSNHSVQSVWGKYDFLISDYNEGNFIIHIRSLDSLRPSGNLTIKTPHNSNEGSDKGYLQGIKKIAPISENCFATSWLYGSQFEIFDKRTGKPTAQLSHKGTKSSPLIIHKLPDGRIASCESLPSHYSKLDNKIKLWDLRKLRCNAILDGHIDPVHSLASCGEKILVSTSGKSTKLWDVYYHKELASIDHEVFGENYSPKNISCLIYSEPKKNQLRLCTAGIGSNINIWDLVFTTPIQQVGPKPKKFFSCSLRVRERATGAVQTLGRPFIALANLRSYQIKVDALSKKLEWVDETTFHQLSVHWSSFERLLDNELKESKEDQEHFEMLGNETLKSYYCTFLLLFRGAHEAARVIHSQFVKNDRKESSDHFASILNEIANQIPLLGLGAKLIGKILVYGAQGVSAAIQAKNAQQRPHSIANLASIFSLVPRDKNIESFIRMLARSLAICQNEDLLLLAQKQVSGFRKKFRSIKHWLLADDSNDPIKTKARTDCENLLRAIMLGKIKPLPQIEQALKEFISHALNDQSKLNLLDNKVALPKLLTSSTRSTEGSTKLLQLSAPSMQSQFEVFRKKQEHDSSRQSLLLSEQSTKLKEIQAKLSDAEKKMASFENENQNRQGIHYEDFERLKKQLQELKQQEAVLKTRMDQLSPEESGSGSLLQVLTSKPASKGQSQYEPLLVQFSERIKNLETQALLAIETLGTRNNELELRLERLERKQKKSKCCQRCVIL